MRIIVNNIGHAFLQIKKMYKLIKDAFENLAINYMKLMVMAERNSWAFLMNIS